jgi:hypothetical protein
MRIRRHAEHVAVNREGEARTLANALDQPIDRPPASLQAGAQRLASQFKQSSPFVETRTEKWISPVPDMLHAHRLLAIKKQLSRGSRVPSTLSSVHGDESVLLKRMQKEQNAQQRTGQPRVCESIKSHWSIVESGFRQNGRSDGRPWHTRRTCRSIRRRVLGDYSEVQPTFGKRKLR